jgi:hypothetical protein
MNLHSLVPKASAFSAHRNVSVFDWNTLMATGEAALGYVALLHTPPIPARLSNYISVVSYTLSFRKPI